MASRKSIDSGKEIFVDKIKDISGSFKDVGYERISHNEKLLKMENELTILKQNGTGGYDYKEKLKEYELTENAGYANEVYYTGGWKWILESNCYGGFWLIGALVVIGLSSSFSGEYSSGMDNIILTGRYGKSKLVSAKIAAALIYCVFTAVVISSVSFAIYTCLLGLHGYDTQLRNITEFYEQTFLNIKIWQFYVCQSILILFGSFTLGLLVLFISSLSRSSILSAFVSGIIFILPDAAERFMIPDLYSLIIIILCIIFKGFIKIQSAADMYKFNYANFIKLEDNNGTCLCNFFGTPVLYENVLVIVLCTLCTLTCVLIFSVFRKREVK